MLIDLFLVLFSSIFCLFRVVDEAGYTSAFHCTLNTHYRIVSYRIVSYCIVSYYVQGLISIAFAIQNFGRGGGSGTLCQGAFAQRGFGHK